VDSGRRLVTQPALAWTVCPPPYCAARNCVFSRILGRSTGGSFLPIAEGRPGVGSPKPGLTFGDSALDAASTLRITMSPFPRTE